MKTFELKFIRSKPFSGEAIVVLGEHTADQSGKVCLTPNCGDLKFFEQEVLKLKDQLDSILIQARQAFEDSN